MPRMLRVTISLLLALLASPLLAQEGPVHDKPLSEAPRGQAVFAKNGMVVAQEAMATQIGVDILKAGGNAVDAAVATGFALAVTYPRAGNIGGGGFMVIWFAKPKKAIAIDYREMAPAAIHKDSFLDDEGNADPQKSLRSGLGIGVPGTVAGLALAHKKYGSGKFTLAQLLAPSIALARDGFVVTGDLADTMVAAKPLFARWPSSVKVMLKPDGSSYGEGDRLVQTDLAGTLEAIANKGPQGFYEGDVAEKIAAAVRDAGGVMTADDFRKYAVKERKPVTGKYRGYGIVSMPPPSSGGVHLIEMLNILERYDLKKAGPSSVESAHLMIEAMRRAYADRAVYLGDPDFVSVPVRGLVSKRYARIISKNIGERATPSSEIRNGDPVVAEGDNTTHFSVVDRFGNAVANTYTLNLSYGNGLIADGTGVLLNNELDDFATKPGAPNAFGLVGATANAPAPRKRPLSSMTPTIVTKDGKPYLVTGSPGGSRIITTVLQIVINVLDHGMDVGAAVSAPRIHHQWLPDEVFAEKTYPENVLKGLAERGHTIATRVPNTSANSILITKDGFAGAADTRTRGATAVGY
jgi:gamma-glutamyltranspeptidase/glutathione hydrolase